MTFIYKKKKTQDETDDNSKYINIYEKTHA